MMPFAGLGGSTGARSPSPSGRPGSASRSFRSYGSTEHPSITGCLLDDPEDKRLRTDGHPLPGRRAAARRRRRDPQPGPRLLPRLHRPRADRRGASTRTAGTAPATSAARRRRLPHHHRPLSDIIIRGGENISARRSRSSCRARRRRRGERRRRPDDPARRARRRGDPGPRRSRRRRPWRRCARTSRPRAWPARSGPSRSTWSTTSLGPPSGKVQKFVLREQLATVRSTAAVSREPGHTGPGREGPWPMEMPFCNVRVIF